MPEAMVNGVRIWYQVTGAGDPVVQIHGAGFGHFNFATATPILSKSFRCIDFDMRGYGQSERPFQRFDMEVWADDVVVADGPSRPAQRPYPRHIHGRKARSSTSRKLKRRSVPEQ